jgi:predicted amidophosphoribosyltransferase
MPLSPPTPPLPEAKAKPKEPTWVTIGKIPVVEKYVRAPPERLVGIKPAELREKAYPQEEEVLVPPPATPTVVSPEAEVKTIFEGIPEPEAYRYHEEKIVKPEPDKILCPICKASLSKAATICNKCGELISPQLPFSCPQCGTKLDTAIGKCKNCGAELIERKRKRQERRVRPRKGTALKLKMCKVCGTKYPVEMETCRVCGEKLDSLAEQPTRLKLPPAPTKN